MLQATARSAKLERKIAAAKASPSTSSSAGIQGDSECAPESQSDTPSVVSTYYATYTNSTLPVDDKTSVFALPRNLRHDPVDLWAADHAAEVHAAAEDMRTNHDGDRRGHYRSAASQLWKNQPQGVHDEYRARTSNQKTDDKRLPTRFE